MGQLRESTAEIVRTDQNSNLLRILGDDIKDCLSGKAMSGDMAEPINTLE